MKFIRKTDMLNHLDLSGLAFTKDQLISLATSLCVCQNLMGVHLNDIGITDDEPLFMEILDIFGLGEVDLRTACRSKFELTQTLQQRNAQMLSNTHHVPSAEIKQVIRASQ